MGRFNTGKRAWLLALLSAMVLAAGCSMFESTAHRQQRLIDENFAASITAAPAYAMTDRFYTEAEAKSYYVGPPIGDASDVRQIFSGPALMFEEAVEHSGDGAFTTIAKGTGMTPDGTNCSVYVGIHNSQRSILDHYRLTDEQANDVESGRMDLVELTTICEPRGSSGTR